MTPTEDMIHKFRQRETEAMEAGYQKFMQSPPIRLLLSMIPSGDHPEALTALLREAYVLGWGSGSSHTTIMVLEASLKRSGRGLL